MENKINIAELLKDAPKGTKLYSPIFGDCSLCEVSLKENMPITVAYQNVHRNFTKFGCYTAEHDAECMLFPSKDCRTWEGFDAPWKQKKHKVFQPFQRVLVKESVDGTDRWVAHVYSHYISDAEVHVCAGRDYYADADIIPYEGNESLLGKEEEV